MKKRIIYLAIIVTTYFNANAQEQNSNNAVKENLNENTNSRPVRFPPKPIFEVDTKMKFENLEHDFGNIKEGPEYSCEFVFKNIGIEPLIIQNCQGSCGCTLPEWSRDPVLPGNSGKIKVRFTSNGRPGSFHKTITVISNAGTKVLSIKGYVEKALENAVPLNDNSILINR